MKKDKTLEEAIPELQEIADELGLKINDWNVFREYFKRQER